MNDNSNKLSKFNDLLNSLEQLTEDQHGMLVGGFAVMGGNALTEIQEPISNGTCTNNCDGGNCVAFCGHK